MCLGMSLLISTLQHRCNAEVCGLISVEMASAGRWRNDGGWWDGSRW